MEIKKYRLEVIKFVVQVMTAICVVATLIISIYPKMKPRNSDLEEMANAGDITSQLRLADMYYSTGDFSKSLYWYDRSLLYEDNDGDRRAKVLNNIAWLYVHGYGLSAEAITEKERIAYAYKWLEKAEKDLVSESVEEIILRNKYILLITFGDSYFENYSEKKDTVVRKMQEKNLNSYIVSERRKTIEKIISSPSPMETGWIDDNTYVIYRGGTYENHELDKPMYHMHYQYLVLTYEEGDSILPELKHIPTSDFLLLQGDEDN